MTNEELNMELYKKMLAEQKRYKQRLMSQPPKEILNHTYEYTVREDILTTLEIHDLSYEQAEALLRSESPLADVFKEFKRRETNYISVVLDSMEACADAEIQKERERLEKARSTSIYPYPLGYALENGEMDQYRESQNLSIACKAAIEQAINDNYAYNRLNTAAAVQQVADMFGYNRMLYVLAITVQHKARDGRISDSSKRWATSVPVYEDKDDRGIDNNIQLVVGKVNPGLVDLFVQEALEVRAREREQQRPEPAKAASAEKPSILVRIKKPVQKNAPNISANKTEPEL